jgi:hypothetical protein
MEVYSNHLSEQNKIRVATAWISTQEVPGSTSIGLPTILDFLSTFKYIPNSPFQSLLSVHYDLLIYFCYKISAVETSL